jgi:RNA polymerase sigma-70 factor (ECF subfamily)
MDATTARWLVFHWSMDEPARPADEDLIRHLADDLDAAFPTLVENHQDRLFTIAVRFLGNRSDAEEAAQDAFIRAYRALDGYPPDRIRELRLRPWLATIVLNVCRNRTRVRRVATTELAFEPAAEPVTDPLVGGHAREAWALLLAELPPAQRTAIVLRHVDGLSYGEMAAALDRPEGTLKAQVHRGLANLRTAFLAAEQRDRKELTA